MFLLSTATASTVTYAQILPNSQSPSTAAGPGLLQQQQPSQPMLHLVKITSPHKGQQVPVGKDVLIYGTSASNGTLPRPTNSGEPIFSLSNSALEVIIFAKSSIDASGI